MAESAAAVGLDQAALEEWGRAVGEAVGSGELPLPLVVALRGPLGAGKSVLARAMARGAGVDGPMPSPTYNLLFSYERPAPDLVVHHLDLYRLEAPEDVWELGWEELGLGRELVLVEWPERAEALLPGDRWEVTLTLEPGAPDRRGLRVEAVGEAPPVPAVEAL